MAIVIVLGDMRTIKFPIIENHINKKLQSRNVDIETKQLTVQKVHHSKIFKSTINRVVLCIKYIFCFLVTQADSL